MRSEMDSLKENGVYELVDRPEGKKVVKSKWVLRFKTNEKGEIEKYKGRVVAKGYSQVEGVDYDQNLVLQSGLRASGRWWPWGPQRECISIKWMIQQLFCTHL